MNGECASAPSVFACGLRLAVIDGGVALLVGVPWGGGVAVLVGVLCGEAVAVLVGVLCGGEVAVLEGVLCGVEVGVFAGSSEKPNVQEASGQRSLEFSGSSAAPQNFTLVKHPQLSGHVNAPMIVSVDEPGGTLTVLKSKSGG
jgi:hypothetical protein